MVLLPKRDSHEESPERPLECSECKKGIKVIYTEIVGDKLTRTCMCADCPELQKRLRGVNAPEHEAGLFAKGATGLACGECGTLLESVQKGHPVGCSECYEVFDQALVTDMLAAHLIPQRLGRTGRKKSSLHTGRALGDTPVINPSLKIIALNEALNDTLSREDYEQAALIRDEIKSLTKEVKSGQDGRKKKK